MRYQQDLQVKLQERYRRLYKAGWSTYEHEARYLCEFIRSIPALRFLVESIERAEPELDPAQWKVENIGWNKFDLPQTEDGHAKLCWYLLEEFAEPGHRPMDVGHAIDVGENNLDSLCRIATEGVVEPLIEYLQERIGDSSDVLHLLERYVRRVEWFEKDRLWAAYEADTKRGEATYDRDVRQFLFDQGIEYPFSQPRSASGEADVVADLDEEDPLVCEIKLFDGDVGYLAKGFHQAVFYANDYRKTSAYLVIFNLTENVLQIGSDASGKHWPPRLEVGGVTVFIIVVSARPQPTASKRGKAQLIKIGKSQLVEE